MKAPGGPMEPPATTWDLHALTIVLPRQLLDFDVATEMPSYGRLTEVHGPAVVVVV